MGKKESEKKVKKVERIRERENFFLLEMSLLQGMKNSFPNDLPLLFFEMSNGSL